MSCKRCAAGELALMVDWGPLGRIGLKYHVNDFGNLVYTQSLCPDSIPPETRAEIIADAKLDIERAVLARVRLCGQCGGTGIDEGDYHAKAPCPTCAPFDGRGFVLAPEAESA